jgi:tetratricopeptide (TPR) repeat protein
MSWSSLASIALAVQPLPAPPPPTAEAPIERIVSTTGYLSGAGDDAEGSWLQLDELPRRLHVPRLSDSELQSWVALVRSASDRGFALRLRFDGAAGRPDAASGTVTYPICSLGVGNVAPLGDEPTNCPATATGPRNRGEAALARGLALVESNPRAGLRFLGEALAAGDLAPPLRATAHRGRAGAGDNLARDVPWAGEAYDRLMADSLADSRSRLAIAPDDAHAHFSVAEALADLGAYDEALSVYANIGRRWSEEALHVATGIGSVYRRQGDYGRALGVLDTFAARNGRPEGMRFAYHRAWTLVMLGRHRDALTELDIGMRMQPDYVGAYELRSCAHAALGQIAEAVGDEERAIELLENQARDGIPGMETDIARDRRLVAALRGTRGRANGETLDLACRVPWQDWTRTRARSPLLPAAG